MKVNQTHPECFKAGFILQTPSNIMCVSVSIHSNQLPTFEAFRGISLRCPCTGTAPGHVNCINCTKNNLALL